MPMKADRQIDEKKSPEESGRDHFLRYRPWLVLAIPLLTVSLFLTIRCSPESESGVMNRGMDLRPMDGFVGSPSCQTCHQEEMDAWEGSHHERAMARATEASVRGSFDGQDVQAGSETFRPYRDADGNYRIQIKRDGDQEPSDREVTHTFGWEPLQQYLVPGEKGRWQVLPVAWDTEKERWFALFEIDPEEDPWLHWQGGGMTWNSMCADCHSTALDPGLDPQSGKFETTFSEINVACEACHGPGKEHLEWAESEVSGGMDPYATDVGEWHRGVSMDRMMAEMKKCAACHSVRQPLTANNPHGERFLDHYDPSLPLPDLYTADGQILEEVFEWGSFLQSRMAHEGVTCSDCHDPHSLELRAPLAGNQLCLQCHEPAYNEPTHNNHPTGTEATQCISCHMPERIYMEVDGRRDHSFRVPRPDLSVAYGVPNACIDCHAEESNQWAADAVERWFGPNRTVESRDLFLQATEAVSQNSMSLSDSEIDRLFEELKRLSQSPEATGVIRSVALRHAVQLPHDAGTDLLEQALFSESALLRQTAARSLSSTAPEFRRPLLSRALVDSIRAVRMAALQGLFAFDSEEISTIYQPDYEHAFSEYEIYLDRTASFPSGRMNRAQLLERQEEWEAARDVYETLLGEDPEFHPARLNLATLLHRFGLPALANAHLDTLLNRNPGMGEAHYARALLLSEQGDLDTAQPHFDRAAELMPEAGRVHYNRAIAYQTLGDLNIAEQSYRKALNLDPGNTEYHRGLLSLYLQHRRTEKALEQARKLLEIDPRGEDIQRLINELASETGN